MRYLLSHFEKKSVQNAHVRISNSRFTQNEVKKYYACDSRVIEPVIDTELFSPGSNEKARKQLHMDEEERPIILFVGNPVYSKGFDIFSRLAKAHPEYAFHAVCVPIPSPAPVNVHVHGPQSSENVREFYRAADVLIFPSRYEGFGFVPLEALACSCPVIASRVGIFHDFEHSNARIIPHDFWAFEKAMIEAIEHPPQWDKDSDWAARFSPELFAQNWKSVLGENNVF